MLSHIGNKRTANYQNHSNAKYIIGHLTCRYSLILIDALVASSTNSLRYNNTEISNRKNKLNNNHKCKTLFKLMKNLSGCVCLHSSAESITEQT